MRHVLAASAALFLAAACSDDEPLEVHVDDPAEPIYCYKSLAGVECFHEPFHKDSARLVNYRGPEPGRYAEPAKPVVPPLKAPAPIDYWVKDDEPIPTKKVYLRDLRDTDRSGRAD